MAPTESDEAYAKRMLARADKILEAVDEAFIVKQRGHHARPMPTFRPEEVSLGPLLGTGGFAFVNEIKKFTLDDEAGAVEAAKENENSGAPQKEDEEEGDDRPLVEISVDGNNNDKDKQPSSEKETAAVAEKDLPSKEDNHDFHYDIGRARRVMSQRVIRNGKGRYALKRLHDDLTTLEKARGMVDLAVEAKYLSIVWHPNIVKMRGMASGPMVDEYFFIILDRLVDTLDKRMNRWHDAHKKYNRGMCGMFKNKKGLEELVLEAMTIAYDLAAAFFYLHENR
mmetsp:Transcript_21434/g.44700  ORF Transcript_21434/g.44700 Transcript_21434/m.44700 type:complete len:282 (-) Transcript_21434:1057-1902(-)